MKILEGFSARLEEDNLGLVLEDGIAEEKLWMSALEMASGMAQLEEGQLLDPNESTWEHEEVESPEIHISPWGIAERTPRVEGAYRAAQIELYEPPGTLLLRRIVEDGGDVLEIATPNGSVYTYEYDSVREQLRLLLPR
jgi:hypothetical protein